MQHWGRKPADLQGTAEDTELAEILDSSEEKKLVNLCGAPKNVELVGKYEGMENKETSSYTMLPRIRIQQTYMDANGHTRSYRMHIASMHIHVTGGIEMRVYMKP